MAAKPPIFASYLKKKQYWHFRYHVQCNQEDRNIAEETDILLSWAETQIKIVFKKCGNISYWPPCPEQSRLVWYKNRYDGFLPLFGPPHRARPDPVTATAIFRIFGFQVPLFRIFRSRSICRDQNFLIAKTIYWSHLLLLAYFDLTPPSWGFPYSYGPK